MTNIAIENGDRNIFILDFPIEHGDLTHSYVSYVELPEGMGKDLP